MVLVGGGSGGGEGGIEFKFYKMEVGMGSDGCTTVQIHLMHLNCTLKIVGMT